MIRYAMFVFAGSLVAAAPSHSQSRPAENIIRDLSSALLSREVSITLKLFDLDKGGYA